MVLLQSIAIASIAGIGCFVLVAALLKCAEPGNPAPQISDDYGWVFVWRIGWAVQMEAGYQQALQDGLCLAEFQAASLDEQRRAVWYSGWRPTEPKGGK